MPENSKQGVLARFFRAILGNLFREISKAHGNYVRVVCAHPIALIPLAVLYVLFALSFGLLCITVGQLIHPQKLEHVTVMIITLTLIFFAFVFALAMHYLFITVLSFLSATSFKGLFGPVLRVIQLVATTVFFFSVIHYYIVLFTDGVAYDGLSRPTEHFMGLPERLMFVPSMETVVDCLYFSTVTMATVGYGDIHPVTIPAKVATMAQIFFSFGLIVVVLGWVIGHAKDYEDSAAPPAGHTPGTGAPV